MEPLADPDALASETGMEPSDPRLLLALTRASDRFRGAVRHPVSLVVDDTVVLDCEGAATVALPYAPVIAVSSVTVHGHPLAAGEYTWSADGFLRSRWGWPNGLRAVEVVYSHGWDPVPGDIADAVLRQAELLLAQVDRYAAIQVGEERFTFATTGVTQGWTEVIERYRLNRGDRA